MSCKLIELNTFTADLAQPFWKTTTRIFDEVDCGVMLAVKVVSLKVLLMQVVVVVVVP